MSCGRPTIRAPRPQKSVRGESYMSVEKPSLTIKQPKKTIDWTSVGGLSMKLSEAAYKIMDLRKEFYIRLKDESEQTKEALRDLGAANWKYALLNIHKLFNSQEDIFVTTLELLDRVSDPVKKESIGIRLFGTQYEDVKGVFK
ncbi:hypothetical protein NRS6092_02938 [Bacillus subtilis]|nr:hypothetical protein NRS6092_02938 [Bacillus subtilis]